ncbi:MAG: hypothetical protein ACRELF_04810, partial [Gemmataceae bacterium]
FYRFARQATARKYQVPATDLTTPSPTPVAETYKHLYELTTGGATLAEALAQQRMRSGKAATRQPRTREILTLPRISLAAHPWKRMIGDRVPAEEPLARWVPEDNYYAAAHGIRAYVDLAKLLDQWGGNVLHAFELTSRDEQIRARYEKQLCLPAERLAKKVGFVLVRDLAITGSDLYWREGSDVSVLFHVADRKRFLETVDPFLREARKEFGVQLKQSKSNYWGAAIDSYVTPLREISLHRTAVEDVVIYSNSLAALHRILDTRDDPAHSLLSAEDFRYMRTVFRRNDKDEAGFAFLSDAFIRRLLSPASKIKEQRRLQALASLTLAHHAVLFHAWETGRLPANQKQMLDQSALDGAALRDPEGEEVTWNTARQVAVSKVFGTRNFLTPLVELPIDRVTAEEEKDYRNFVREYQRLWQRYLDPAGLRLTTRGREIRVETHILPVVRTQGYDFLRQITGGQTTTFDLSRLSPRTIVQILSTFDGGRLGLEGAERGDKWALLTLEDSPVYRTLIEWWLKREFVPNREMELDKDWEQLLSRLPLTFGLHLPGDKDGTASAQQGQGWLNLGAGHTEGKIKPYRGTEITRGRIPNAITNTIYHARIDDAWYVSLSQGALHRLIDQSIRRRDKKTPPQPIEAATSLFLAPQALLQSTGAVFGYLEWESHRRALANGPAWYALYRGGLLAADAKEATRRTIALRHLGFVPVSPDGSAYRFDAGRDEVTNERHGSYSRPRLGDGLDERSAGQQVLGSLRTLRVDLRFREDGVQTALSFDRKNAGDKTTALNPAYRAIFKLGGWVERDESQSGNPVLRVYLAGTKTGDADLVALKKIQGLHTLILDATAVTDAGLKQLRDVPALRELHLDTPGVSDAGTACLQDMKQLRILRRTDKERFLAEIRLLGGSFDEGALDLAGMKITDAWLARLKAVPHLKKLNLRSTPLTDEGLANLAVLKDLQVLDLTDTAISNAGLKHLRGLKALKRIILHETAVTDSGAAELRKALPALKIVRSTDLEEQLKRYRRLIARAEGRMELKKDASGQPHVKLSFYSKEITAKQLADLRGLLTLLHELSLDDARGSSDD